MDNTQNATLKTHSARSRRGGGRKLVAREHGAPSAVGDADGDGAGGGGASRLAEAGVAAGAEGRDGRVGGVGHVGEVGNVA